MRSGTLYGVGIGPGDPELITVKGLRLLQEVKHVFLPATAPGRSFAGNIAAPYIDPARQQITLLVCPPIRDRVELVRRWYELAEQVAGVLMQGHDAVFLTEGDPSLYSTYQYLKAGLLHGVHPNIEEQQIITVPGISSVSAAAAAAGIPLGMWDERVAIVPATAADAAIVGALTSFETTVIMKPGKQLAALAGSRPEMDVTLVRRAGWPEQVILHGEPALEAAGEDYFSLLIMRRKNN